MDTKTQAKYRSPKNRRLPKRVNQCSYEIFSYFSLEGLQFVKWKNSGGPLFMSSPN